MDKPSEPSPADAAPEPASPGQPDAPGDGTKPDAVAAPGFRPQDFAFPRFWDANFQMVTQEIFRQYTTNPRAPDAAVRDATLLLETRVRTLCDAPPELIGPELMAYAFKADGGKLIPPALNKSEAEGVYFLFTGAIKQIRNPVGHRHVNVGPNQAFNSVAIIDYLLNLASDLVREKYVYPFLPRSQRLFGILDTKWLDIDGDGNDEFILLVNELSQNQPAITRLLAVREEPFEPVPSSLPPIEREGLLPFLHAVDIDGDGVHEVVASATSRDRQHRLLVADWNGTELRAIPIEGPEPTSGPYPFEIVRPVEFGGAPAIAGFDEVGGVQYYRVQDGKIRSVELSPPKLKP